MVRAASVSYTHLDVYKRQLFYFLSAFAVNRVALFIENRVQVPGMIGGGK